MSFTLNRCCMLYLRQLHIDMLLQIDMQLFSQHQDITDTILQIHSWVSAWLWDTIVLNVPDYVFKGTLMNMVVFWSKFIDHCFAKPSSVSNDINELTMIFHKKNLSQTFRLLALERKEGPGRHVCVKTDVNKCGLAGVDPLDKDAWWTGVRHNLVLLTGTAP